MSDPVPSSIEWGTLTTRRLGQLMTAIEEQRPEAADVVAALQRQTWPGLTVGVTGPPGSGKSTLISALVRELRRRRERVGVVAVDPSSDRTGGAFLGDRLRMMEHATDADVLVRSIATRGHGGGVAPAVSDLARLLRAAGYAWVLIETVGAGQVETDVVARADVTLLVQAPGLGDEIQALKKGILEVADLVVVNKSDQPGAVELRRQLETWAASPERVLATCATSGEGIAELLQAIDARRPERASETSRLRARREEVRGLALAILRDRLDASLRDADVTRGTTWEAAERLVASLRFEP
ncbi:MAG: methylmalonyl Co-A mutase-associated GTPase MeaB [Opitutaceae bacterium]|nr:methylmalonyl Co-A mutase-associated GTPase MeaB [Opitutaceae bacterium]